ncbi:hypothetical protein BDZ45DRAFT_749007 [Acephala macrosclerotiorum]|nr:hypothetical protein BDZ45DRAFT_749007 [Acephala macrosclerotiorum]
MSLTELEKELFVKLEKDYKDVKRDIKEQTSIVHDFGDSKSERVPWLERMAFLYHTTTLKDEKIWSSYKLPPRKELDTGSKDAEDPSLARVLVVVETQRANILNEFYVEASSKANGFRYFKNASTLITYFTTIKQLLVYYYRVVHRESGHFTRVKLDQVLLKDVIQSTAQQIQAMDEIMKALDLEDEVEAELALKHAIRRLYLALICQTRQFAASITKEKFSVKERANFDLEKSAEKNIENELDLVALVELSNYTFYTFNYVYTGTTTLTMNTLLYWNYRASESWRTFFRFDHMLQRKRPRDALETLSLRMLDTSKRGQMRKKSAYIEIDLLAVARKLYNALDLQFRVPGQRNRVLVVMGSQPAEQVVLVIETGSSKTLIVMIGAAVADTRTTILAFGPWSSPSIVNVTIDYAWSNWAEAFIEHNKLVRLRIIRESINRSNIKYMFVIVVTFALGIEFDYFHVRWIIHVDASSEASAFSQESDRVDRDGKKASSIVLLHFE